MNGYDFVERILGQTNYDVSPLIDFAEGRETEWLEFKAASRPTDGKYEKRDNKWDYFWEISKSLVGLANHIGGVLLLGVGETKNCDKPVVAVNLELSGFNGARDDFMRNVVRSNLISSRIGWATGSSGYSGPRI